jgi:hypothetical protein
LILVEAEDRLAPANEDRAADQVRLLHHEIDRLFLRPWQWPLLEHRTAGADEVEKPVSIDVALEKRAIGRIAIDVVLFDADVLLLQKTSGVAARRSRRFPVEDGLRHPDILA